MPMIDVTAAAGTFPAEHAEQLLARLTTSLLTWEKALGNRLAAANTGAFLHALPAAHVAASGKADAVVRVELLTPPGALSQEQRQGITADATRIVEELAAGTPRPRTWVLFREAVDGGWGLLGRAWTNADIAAALRGAAAAPAPAAAAR